MGNLYDGVFRTILNDCGHLVIPVINEIFGESYTGDEKVEFHPNEHLIARQDEAGQRRITDSNFRITGSKTKKYHLECESGYPDGRIAVRLFEYDAQIALDEGEAIEETLTVTFPNTAVLYLRIRKKTPDKMEYVLVTPGGTVRYDIPIMKVQEYSLDDIFSKQLLMLIPFYIFSYENKFLEYDSSSQKLEELIAAYKKIVAKLDEREQQGVIGAFDKRTIIELSGIVIKEITKKFGNVQKGVGDVMYGALIETEARTILNKGKKEGRREGRIEGRKENQRETAVRMLKAGKLTFEEVAQYSGLDIEQVKQLGR